MLVQLVIVARQRPATVVTGETIKVVSLQRLRLEVFALDANVAGMTKGVVKDMVVVSAVGLVVEDVELGCFKVLFTRLTNEACALASQSQCTSGWSLGSLTLSMVAAS